MAFRFVAVTFALFVGLAPGGAGAVTLVSQARQVHAKGQFTPFFQPPGPVDEHTQTAPDFGPFSGSVAADADPSSRSAGYAIAAATQTSTIDAPAPGALLQTSISGHADASAANSYVTIDMLSLGDSEYSLGFEVAEEAVYVLNAIASVSEYEVPFSGGLGQVLIELRRGSDVIEQWSLSSLPDQAQQATFDASGALLPGSYVLHVLGQAAASAVRDVSSPPGTRTFGSGTADFDVDFQVVPEPGTLGALAAGLFGLAARRRGPRRAPSGEVRRRS
jgi:hypothetical protein